VASQEGRLVMSDTPNGTKYSMKKMHVMSATPTNAGRSCEDLAKAESFVIQFDCALCRLRTFLLDTM